MSGTREEKAVCQVCGNLFPRHQLLPGGLVRRGIAGLIRESNPDWDESGYVCLGCLNRLRSKYVERLMEREFGELDELERAVAKSLSEHELLAENINEAFDERLSIGQRIADKVAEFGGSWSFILSFVGFIFVWVLLNTVLLIWRPFDPYPFILLNLVLSMLAAFQAPVIMMSQNRQEARDRLRAQSDYKVNLKAELEIRLINEKLDQLIHHQLTRLLEVQEIQMEMIDELARRGRR